MSNDPEMGNRKAKETPVFMEGIHLYFGKKHRDKQGIHHFVRKSKVKLETATLENMQKPCLGAVEKENKNGWLKLRTYGLLNTEKIILAFPET
jgi:hypothetical protein